MLRQVLFRTAIRKVNSIMYRSRTFLTFKPIQKLPAFEKYPQLVEVTSTEAEYNAKIAELSELKEKLVKDGINAPIMRTDIFGRILENPRLITTEHSMIANKPARNAL